MPRDPSLPSAVIPASGAEAYVVTGRRRGAWVEVTLTRATRQSQRFGADRYRPTGLLAIKRFRGADIAGYTTFGGHLEDTARVAARGELGYRVHTSVDGGAVVVRLLARRLEPDGRIHTEIHQEHRFEDADSPVTLIQANEKAAELRAMASELTEAWVAELDARVHRVRAEYERLDAETAAAEDLARIIDSQPD